MCGYMDLETPDFKYHQNNQDFSTYIHKYSLTYTLNPQILHYNHKCASFMNLSYFKCTTSALSLKQWRQFLGRYTNTYVAQTQRQGADSNIFVTCYHSKSNSLFLQLIIFFLPRDRNSSWVYSGSYHLSINKPFVKIVND